MGLGKLCFSGFQGSTIRAEPHRLAVHCVGLVVRLPREASVYVTILMDMWPAEHALFGYKMGTYFIFI